MMKNKKAISHSTTNPKPLCFIRIVVFFHFNTFALSSFLPIILFLAVEEFIYLCCLIGVEFV